MRNKKRGYFRLTGFVFCGLLLVCIFSVPTMASAASTYGWAKKIGETGSDVGQAVAVDAEGNRYITGYFSTEAVNFAGDTSWNGNDVRNWGEGEDAFVTKINANGSYGWTRTFGRLGNERGKGVAVDTSGNVYVVGLFSGGTVDFRDDFPGNTTDIRSWGGGASDVFVIKINPDGGYLWARTIGGSGADAGNAITVDSNGNAYITGDFYGTIDFRDDFDTTSESLRDNEGGGGFITKINSDGSYGWTKRTGIGYGISLSAGDTLCVTGIFSGTNVDFSVDYEYGDTTHPKTSLNTDIFVACSEVGTNPPTFSWARMFGGYNNANEKGYGVTIGDDGKVYITGVVAGDSINFRRDPEFGNTTDIKDNENSEDAFIIQLNADGSYGWTRTFGGQYNVEAWAIALDPYSDDLYITGWFGGSVTFGADFGSTADQKTASNQNIFIASIGVGSTTPTYGWTKYIGGSGVNEYGYGIAVSPAGNVYSTGRYSTNNLNFGSDWGVSNPKALSGSYDAFIVKIIIRDTDEDGLIDSLESCSSATNPDSDNDGLCDGNLTVADVCIAGEDIDADGTVDTGETSPCDADTDDDGLNDGEEIILGTDPLDSDSDDDGATDGAEDTNGTSPLLWDTDEDGLSDGFEIANSSGHGTGENLDPLTSSDGASDFDGDGIANAHEYWNGTDLWTDNPAGYEACGYWGEADGDGWVTGNDYDILNTCVTSGCPDLSAVIPPTGETLDIDADGWFTGNDLDLLNAMMTDAATPSLQSRPTEISVVSDCDATMVEGDTCHVSVKVKNSLSPAADQAAMPVLFTIDEASDGEATIFGGEGDGASGGRFDITNTALSEPFGLAWVMIRADEVGTVIINATVPQCGITMNSGRSSPEITEDAMATIEIE